MPIAIKESGVKVNIVDIITKTGGVVLRNLPLRAKIGGIVVDFISYKGNEYYNEALVSVGNSGFSVTNLINVINSIDLKIKILVEFEDGIYLFDKPLQITRSNISFKGTINTILKCNGDFTVDTSVQGIINVAGAESNRLENILIERLNFDGNYIVTTNKSRGISTNYVGGENVGIVIRNCIVKGNSKDGIHLDSTSNNIINDNMISNNAFYGIWANTSSNNNTISRNSVSNNGSYGIYLNTFSNNNTVSGNSVSNNNDSGISLNNSNNNTVSGNTISNNSSFGIKLVSTSNNNTVSGNIISNNYYGIYLNTLSNNNTVSGNSVSNNMYDGINVSVSSNNNTVSGNTVSNNNNGIYLSSSNNNLIQSNQSISNKSANISNDGTGNKLNFNIMA